MVDVARWLAGLGLERYAELFGKDCPSDLKGAWDQLRASR